MGQGGGGGGLGRCGGCRVGCRGKCGGAGGAVVGGLFGGVWPGRRGGVGSGMAQGGGGPWVGGRSVGWGRVGPGWSLVGGVWGWEGGLGGLWGGVWCGGGAGGRDQKTQKKTKNNQKPKTKKTKKNPTQKPPKKKPTFFFVFFFFFLSPLGNIFSLIFVVIFFPSPKRKNTSTSSPPPPSLHRPFSFFLAVWFRWTTLIFKCFWPPPAPSWETTCKISHLHLSLFPFFLSPPLPLPSSGLNLIRCCFPLLLWGQISQTSKLARVCPDSFGHSLHLFQPRSAMTPFLSSPFMGSIDLPSFPLTFFDFGPKLTFVSVGPFPLHLYPFPFSIRACLSFAKTPPWPSHSPPTNNFFFPRISRLVEVRWPPPVFFSLGGFRTWTSPFFPRTHFWTPPPLFSFPPPLPPFAKERNSTFPPRVFFFFREFL